MKLLSLIFLSLFTIQIQAQSTHLQGSIVDAQTDKPIPSATLSVASKNFFYPTDDSGKFTIDENKLNGADTLSVSCIGYQTQKFLVKDIAANAIVKLSPATMMLSEVKVGFKLIKVGSRVRSGFGKASLLPGMQLAMFMEGSNNHSGTIKSVGYYLSNGSNILYKGHGDATAPFRVRIFAVDTNGTPGKELTKDIIIASAKKNNEWFDVDLSAYQIESPESGFFVAFALLDESYYKINTHYKAPRGVLGSSEEIQTPHIAFTQHEFKESQSYTGTPLAKIKWHKDSFNDSYMIRATIIGN